MLRKCFVVRCWFVLFLILAQLNIVSAQVNFRQISLEQGLPGESIKEIFQDQFGVMWFGIEPIGLCKFDGKEYTTFGYNPDDSASISNNFVNCIVEGEEEIWIGTADGLNKLNRFTGKFTRFLNNQEDNQSIPDNFIFDLLYDEDGYLWIGTHKGVSKLNILKNEYIHFLTPEENNGLDILVTSIQKDKKGNIWIATRQKGLLKISAKSDSLNSLEWKNTSLGQLKNIPEIKDANAENLNSIDAEIFTDIRTLEYDTTGNLYVGTNSGVFVYDTYNNNAYKIDFDSTGGSILEKGNIADLIIDNSRQLWIGTYLSGVGIYNLKNKKLTYLHAKDGNSNGLKDNIIRSIFEDKSGLVWVGTKFQGINLYDPRQTTFNLIKGNITGNSLSDDYILSLGEDFNNNILIGTIKGGLNIYNPENQSVKIFQHDPKNSNSLKNNRISSIYPVDNENIWIGTDDGLDLFKKKQEIFIHYGDFNIRSISKRNQDEIWVGSRYDGLYLFNVHKKQFYRNKSKHTEFFGDTNLDIRRILKDKSGRLWFATHYNGLFLYNENTDSLVHFYNTEDEPGSISGNLIRSICEDKSGNIWVGTKSKGLNRYVPDSNKFVTITTKDDLPSNSIYSILEDNEGNLWMGSHNGLIKYSVKEKKVEHYNELYGLHGRSFEVNAFLKSRNGNLYFGGSSGLNYFNPSLIIKKEYVAPLIISSLKKYDEIIDVDITRHKDYILNHKDNYISISYALLDFSDPNSNQYKYILGNFDKKWIDAGNRTFASYTSLPPGEYTFRVKGCNIDEDWNEEGLSIDIIIPAPFWKKTWFFILIVLFVGAIIISISQYRINLIKRNENRLKKLVQEKTSDLQNANQILENQKDEIKSQNKELENHRNYLEKLVAKRTAALQQEKTKVEESEFFLKESQRTGNIGSYKMSFETGFWFSTETLDHIFGIDNSYEKDTNGWLNIVHPEDREMMANYFQDNVIGKHQSFNKEYRIIRKSDNETRWLHGVGKLYFGNNRDLLHMLGTIQDITERKLIEEERKMMNIKLESSVQKRTAQLHQANKDLESFAYSVSHDLRAPIRHIDGFLHLLERAINPMEPMVKNYIDKISLSTKNMSTMIEELLQFSRFGRADLKTIQVNLLEIVNEIRIRFKPDYEKRNINWKIGELPEVYGDPGLLKIAFENLITNAIKYTSKKEQAIIEIGQTKNSLPGFVCVFIKDNGAGFDMAYKDKLFGVFQRLHKSEEFEGTGIGLANVKQIIKRHDGDIDAESEIDKGATFYVTLPDKRTSTAN